MDRPGLIGFIGQTLGNEGVNIAQMNVGREDQGGEAIGVVNLDSVPSEPGPGNRAAESQYPEPERDQAAPARRGPPWLGVTKEPGGSVCTRLLLEHEKETTR